MWDARDPTAPEARDDDAGGSWVSSDAACDPGYPKTLAPPAKSTLEMRRKSEGVAGGEAPSELHISIR